MKSKPKKLSILVVEDVDEMRELFKHLLQGVEEVAWLDDVTNGSEARVTASKRRPDLVFLDEVLPGESSLDLLQEFSGQGISVALITSMENPLTELPQGAIQRLSKPGWKSVQEDRERFRTFIRKVCGGNS